MHILEFYRLKHGITQRELAEKSGISRQYIAHLENEERKRPSPEVALAIEKATNGEIKKEWLLYPNEYTEEIQAYMENKQLEGVR